MLEEHRRGCKFIDDLTMRKDVEAVKEFLYARNKCSVSEFDDMPAGRTIVFLDCTGSMAGTIAAAKSAISDMIQRTVELLEPMGLSFELQLCAYRNYDCQVQRIFEHSGWETDHAPLKQFINSLTAHGGTSMPEAVELCLEHIVLSHSDEHPVSQAIIIADAPAQERDMTNHKRADSSTNFEGTSLETPVYFREQLKLVAEAQIPIYAVWINPCAQNSFEEIGRETLGGRDQYLDINAGDAVTNLTHIVAQNLLKAAAGKDTHAREELLDTYASKYGGRGYVS